MIWTVVRRNVSWPRSPPYCRRRRGRRPWWFGQRPLKGRRSQSRASSCQGRPRPERHRNSRRVRRRSRLRSKPPEPDARSSPIRRAIGRRTPPTARTPRSSTAGMRPHRGERSISISATTSAARAPPTNTSQAPCADRTLPEEVIVPTTLPTPRELPPTLSELHRGTADAIYTLKSAFLGWPLLLVRTLPRQGLHARRGRQSGSCPRAGAADGLPVPTVYRAHRVGAPDLCMVIECSGVTLELSSAWLAGPLRERVYLRSVTLIIS